MEQHHVGGIQKIMVGRHQLLRTVANWLPEGLKPVAGRVYNRGRHWAHPALREFGTVQDLYYWVADGNLDTLLLLQNYFSAFYPNLDTSTQGAVSLYDKDRVKLGSESFLLPHRGGAKFRVSTILEKIGPAITDNFGSLEVHIEIPKGVLERIKDQKSFYFWDRFYVSYTTARGQVCFVHGIDKTSIYRDGSQKPIFWYGDSKDLQWAPETPVNIGDFQRYSVIMINRTARTKSTTLFLSDTADKFLSWEAEIPPGGVHRFELTPESTSSLIPTELRMRVQGMATQYGRPLVFKEFQNGAISAMHC